MRTKKNSKFAPKKLIERLNYLKNKRVIITAHSSADLDACASMLVLQEMLGKNAHIAIVDSINSQAKRILKTELRGFQKFQRAIKKYNGAKIILVDSNNPILCPHMRDIVADIIIDHHAINNSSITAKIEWIDSEAVATAQMLSLLIKKPTPKQARYMIMAILSDSANLSWANEITFRELAKLLPHSDFSYEKIISILKQPKNIQTKAATLEGLRQSSWQKKGGIIVATASVNSHESYVADKLIDAGADAAFVAMPAKRGFRISARIRPRLLNHVDLLKIMNEVAEFAGAKAGGHPEAAALSGGYISKMDDTLILAQKKLFLHTTARIKIKK